MSSSKPIPTEFQPSPDDWQFDLERALEAVVSIQTRIPDDAFTADVLGTERRGSGILIDRSGLIVTIGYLITEADQVWLASSRGAVAEGHILAYDQASGLGLIQAASGLGTTNLQLGSSDDIDSDEEVIIAAAGGIDAALSAQIIGRRPFAGYWEYLLENAIFTSPAHPNWGGAGCLDRAGHLVGIGSLLIQAISQDTDQDGNMIVPIEELVRRLDDLLMKGRVDAPPRPWLGLFATDGADSIGVTGLVKNGPAHTAGMEVHDRIVAVKDMPVKDLADFYRKVWSLGAAGIEVPITVKGPLQTRQIKIVSADRNDFLKKPTMH